MEQLKLCRIFRSVILAFWESDISFQERNVGFWERHFGFQEQYLGLSFGIVVIPFGSLGAYFWTSTLRSVILAVWERILVFKF